MILSTNDFIREDAIFYIRCIKKLGEGYRKEAYPDYSVFLHNSRHYIAIDNLLGIELPTYYEIEDVIPKPAFMGYPQGSKICHYIKLKHVIFTLKAEDYFELCFPGNIRLAIYNQNVYKNIVSSLETD